MVIKMDDEKIVDLYWKRDESAIAETSKKYGSYCYTIAFSVLGDSGDSEECVNDTYMKAWNSMPEARPAKLSFFLGRITRNIALNKYRYYSAKRRAGTKFETSLEELEESLGGAELPDDTVDRMAFDNVINSFLDSLSEKNRNVFVERYWFSESVDEIAVKNNISRENVYVRLSRIRNDLKYILEKAGELR